MSDSMPSSNEDSKPPDTPSPGEGEASLLDFAIVLAKHKKLILGFTIAAAIIGAAYAYRLPEIFTAVTKMVPPQQNQSASALLASLGGAGGIAAAGIAGIKNPNDLYLAMLRSRTLTDSMLERFEVYKLHAFKYSNEARQWLESRARFTASREGIITIEVDDTDPKRAADIANAYVDELQKFTGQLALTEASQKRLFFERQFIQAKDNLSKTEAEARKAMQQGGLVKVDEQARGMVESTARLRAQISTKEVEIASMKLFATDRNPDLLRAQQHVESLRRELARFEGTDRNRSGSASTSSNGIENFTLLRDVKYHEFMFELIAKQFEMAKLDEVKETSAIQVMDKAIVPDGRSKPNRRLIAVVSTLIGFFLGIIAAVVLEAIVKAGQDPRQAERMREFKRHLALR